jgi:type II secretion system protein H
MMMSRIGFTLIEILLVLVIMGIVLALAVPDMSKAYQHLQLNKTSEDLLDLSRWAQAMAMQQGRIYALAFSGNRRSYKIERTQTTDDEEDQADLEPVQGAAGKMHDIPDAVHLETMNATVNFYPDGSVDPTDIRLNTSSQKTVLSSTVLRGTMIEEARQ